MKSKRLSNTIKLLIIILILAVAVFVGYYIKNKKNPFVDIVNNFKKDSALYDNLNGIYTYKETLDKTRNPFSGCAISEMNNHILIINDDYKVYRSSCMGTYLKDEGKVDQLNIKTDSGEEYIEYDDHKFTKDYFTTAIVPNNRIQDYFMSVDLSNLEFVLKETQFPGNYYLIEAPLRNNGNLFLVYDKNPDSDEDSIRIRMDEEDVTVYQYSFEKYDELPKFYSFGSKTVIIEEKDNKNSRNKFGYHFNVINSKEVEYNIENMFPIVINNENLTFENNSVYIFFDEKDRQFKMFVGYDKKMCNEEGSEHRPIYYEFKITYNYSQGHFEKPEFVKVGYEDEKCNYISNYINGG